MKLYKFGSSCVYWGPALNTPGRTEFVLAWNDIRLCSNRELDADEQAYADAIMIAFDKGSWKPIFRRYNMHWKEFHGL